ncbi:MAG: FecR domain-containing protein [Terriglobia bacterium]
MGTRFWLATVRVVVTICFFSLAVQAQETPIVIGQAVVSTETTQNGIALPSGGTIFDGDLIETGASGRAVVKLSPTNQVTLNVNTAVRFARVVERTWLRLQKGTIVVEYTGKDFAVVETPKFHIVPATEGTSRAYVGLMADNSTYIESAEGNVTIDDIKSGQSYVLPAGQSALVAADASIVPGLQAKAAPPAPPAKETAPTPPPPAPRKPPSHKTALIVGIAAAAGIGGGVAALSGGGGGQPASPSAP